jgi:hypothetical protein
LKGARFFTKMDLTTRYHQVGTNATDTWNTTFKTKFGLYEWMLMPFGFTNALATFKRVINDIFKENLGKIVVIYLDDTLVFSKTWEDHFLHGHIVPDILHTHKLRVKCHKSYFGKPSIQYLGFVVFAKSVSLDPTKVHCFC